MPLNVRRFFASAALVSSGLIVASAQTTPPTGTASANSTTVAKPAAAPTSAEIMRERISKAKAFIAVKNFNAAIYELENIRRETGDQTVHGVINVLLMNSYLEQGDYTRAQNFLKELAGSSKTVKPSPFYFAVAGQVVKGARNQLERYRALGLTVSDRSLPLEASVDVEKMRETLETVIEQSKTIGADKSKAADAMPLLEEAIVSRANLARDDYDANRWKNSVAETREQMAGSRSIIVNAVNETPSEGAASADTMASAAAPVVNAETASAKPEQTVAQIFKPVADTTNNKTAAPGTTPAVNAANSAANVKESAPEEIKKPSETVKSNEAARPNAGAETAQNTPTRNRLAETAENKETEKKSEPSAEQTAAAPVENADNSPLQVGSLVSYATTQAKPVYPVVAKNMRLTGIVKVEVLVNENGEVAEVQNTSGPSMLQRAASDAVRKWKFKPFVRGGQPTKASGFVNFNFSL